LYVDQSKIKDLENPSKKDILLFLKGEKIFYYNNEYNYNCSYKTPSDERYPILLTKNPLVRLSNDGKNLAVDYNNILSPESYQNNSKYQNCRDVSNNHEWWQRNRNMIGIYDIEFSSKWFMVTVVMKEVADNNNILTKNRAICRLYINGLLVFENKVETIYGSNQDIYSATFKNNNSPLYVNPSFIIKESADAGANTKRHNNIPYFDFRNATLKNSQNPIDVSGIVKLGDLKYYNYALDNDSINQLFRKGLKNEKVVDKTDVKYSNFNMLSSYELEKNQIKEL
jgi:hypothetical protein